MNQHDPTDAADVLHADWDFEQVDALFCDLREGAEVRHVQVRTSSPQRVDDRAMTLDQAHSLMHSGDAKAIQIRYDFDGQSWCDTLMIQDQSVRVIRTTLPSSD